MATKTIDQLTSHPRTVADSLDRRSLLVVRDPTLPSDNTVSIGIDQLRGGSNVVSILDFGAKCDNTTDDTAAIQAAMDTANAIFEQDQISIATVLFPPGKRSRITSQLLWRRGTNLVCPVPHSDGFEFVWWGALDTVDPVLQEWGPGGTGTSNKVMSGFLFRAGGVSGLNTPTNWYAMDAQTGSGMDLNTTIQFCTFGRCSGDAMVIKSWVNLHMRHMRFQDVGGFGIMLRPRGAGLNGSSFMLSDFTLANDTHGGSGLLCIDNTINAPNLGVVEVRNGRYEYSTTMNANSAFVTGIGGGNTRFAQVRLSNVYMQDSGGNTDDAIFYNSGTPSEPFTIQVQNLAVESIANFLSNWSTSIVMPTANYYPFSCHTAGFQSTYDNTPIRMQSPVTTSTPLRTFVTSDANPRMQMDSTGKHSWGDGTAAVDTTLYRAAADTLKTDDDFQVGTGTWNGARLRLGGYYLWVDAGGLLRIKSGAPGSDLDGTIVGVQA